MVAIFNGFGGGASALVGLSYIFAPDLFNQMATSTLAAVPKPLGGSDTSVSLMLSLIIGGITLSGSIIAFAKLQELMTGSPILFKGQNAINLILALGMFGLAAYAGFFATGDQVGLISVIVAVSGPSSRQSRGKVVSL